MLLTRRPCSQGPLSVSRRYYNTYQQTHAFSHIIQKAVDNNLSEERIECLTCDRSNYSVRFSAPYPTPPHPCMTHPIPA